MKYKILFILTSICFNFTIQVDAQNRQFKKAITYLDATDVPKDENGMYDVRYFITQYDIHELTDLKQSVCIMMLDLDEMGYFEDKDDVFNFKNKFRKIIKAKERSSPFVDSVIEFQFHYLLVCSAKDRIKVPKEQSDSIKKI